MVVFTLCIHAPTNCISPCILGTPTYIYTSIHSVIFRLRWQKGNLRVADGYHLLWWRLWSLKLIKIIIKTHNNRTELCCPSDRERIRSHYFVNLPEFVLIWLFSLRYNNICFQSSCQRWISDVFIIALYLPQWGQNEYISLYVIFIHTIHNMRGGDPESLERRRKV